MKRRSSNIKKRRAAGFTLMEAVFAIMIIGLGIAALMQVFAAGTSVNGYGSNLSTGVFLAEELRSMTDDVMFGDLLTYDGQSFNGVDANGLAVAGLDSYQQQLSVQAVNPDDLTEYIGADPEMILITAAVNLQGESITRMSWLRSR